MTDGREVDVFVEEAIADPKAFRERMRAGRSGPVVMVAGQRQRVRPYFRFPRFGALP